LASSTIVTFETDWYKGRVDDVDGKPFFHFVCSKWSHNAYKKLLDSYLCICDELKSMGYTEIFSSIPTGDNKLLKFQTMFCLEPLYVSDSVIICKRSL
jgi:hypothetical protein